MIIYVRCTFIAKYALARNEWFPMSKRYQSSIYNNLLAVPVYKWKTIWMEVTCTDFHFNGQLVATHNISDKSPPAPLWPQAVKIWFALLTIHSINHVFPNGKQSMGTAE